MRKSPVACLVILGAMLSGPVQAQPEVEYPQVVPEFLSLCTSGELTAAAREAAFADNGAWAAEAPDVDVPSLAISRAISRNFDFSKPISVKQWSRTIDGVKVRAVVASFPEKRRHSTICAFVVPGVKAGWSYNDAFKAGTKALGLKGKSTDLPHYFEYTGKIGPNKHSVRAEVSGRTRSVSDKDAMHLYIAF